MPRSEYALTWAKLGQQYGPVVWLAIPGQNFLILNSIEDAKELLEQRGSIYADRPRWVMAGELMGKPLHYRQSSPKSNKTFAMQV